MLLGARPVVSRVNTTISSSMPSIFGLVLSLSGLLASILLRIPRLLGQLDCQPEPLGGGPPLPLAKGGGNGVPELGPAMADGIGAGR